ncbi:hypothetical protein [Candidatus Uabimicrobium sp. HlEnr_7]|uniref:hypothetical protein n=1 Tax=Candidatus Uabimicrobium helgolandensis TaxID=3095367 RepID=UPI003556571E
MNFWQSPLLISFIKKITNIFILTLCLSAQEVNEGRLLSLFSVLEDKNTDKNLQNETIKRIVNLGKSVKPYIEKRLTTTQNPLYFYIIQQLSQKKTKTKWEKNDHFLQHYQQALDFAKQTKYEEASKIIKAILLLEKNLPFQNQMEKSLKTIERKQKIKNQVIITKSYTTAKYYSFKDKLNFIIAIKNNGFKPITIICGKKHLDLKITSTKFFLSGDNRTDITTKTPKIDERMTIKGGEWWKAEVNIPQKFLKKECYQEFEVETQIKLATLQKAGKNHFPKIEFPKVTIKVLPKKYHVVMANPIAYFKGAVIKNYSQVLFYSSFFIKNKNLKPAISYLINNLESVSLSSLVKSILVRFTNQNHSTIQRWKNWLRARNWKQK